MALLVTALLCVAGGFMLRRSHRGRPERELEELSLDMIRWGDAVLLAGAAEATLPHGTLLFAWPFAAATYLFRRRPWLWTSLAVTLLVVLLFLGARSYAPLAKTPEQAVWEPQTPYGREVHALYLADLRGLARELPAGVDHLKVLRRGLASRYPEGQPDRHQWCLDLYLDHTYALPDTTFEWRAAHSLARTLSGVSRVLAAHPRLLADQRYREVVIHLEWASAGAVKYDLFGEEVPRYARLEWVELTIPKEALLAFAEERLTLEELARRSACEDERGRLSLGFSGNLPEP
jgi:hypothetical protein